MLLNQALERGALLQLVRNGPFAVILRIQFQVLHDIAQQVPALHGTSSLVLQASEVHVKVVELRVVMDEHSNLVLLDSIHFFDCSKSLPFHFV